MLAFAHSPFPSHLATGVTTPSEQLALAHSVALPGNEQSFPLVPSHFPLQVPVPGQASRLPTGSPVTGLHVPTDPDALHDSHCPSHLVSQQTPSCEQIPEPHSAFAVQFFPLSSVGTQAPEESQNALSPQEVSVQLPEHFPSPSLEHNLEAQVLVVESVHAPEPLHTEAVTISPSLQVAGVQMVCFSGKVQFCTMFPSHVPLQTPAPVQAARGATGSPLTALQVPTEPDSLQDSH